MKDDDIILFVDDSPERAAIMYKRMSERERSRTFWVSTIKEAIDILKNYKDRLYKVYLDYDLYNTGGSLHPSSDTCGMEIVRFLEKQNPLNYKNCVFIIHSWDKKNSKKMINRLIKKGYDANYIPFGLSK